MNAAPSIAPYTAEEESRSIACSLHQISFFLSLSVSASQVKLAYSINYLLPVLWLWSGPSSVEHLKCWSIVCGLRLESLRRWSLGESEWGVGRWPVRETESEWKKEEEWMMTWCSCIMWGAVGVWELREMRDREWGVGVTVWEFERDRVSERGKK